MSIDIEQLFGNHEHLLQEYCQLAVCETLSQSESVRLAEILMQAEQDTKLTFLLNEVDHFMAHELGLLTQEYRQAYRLQQSELRNFISERSPSTMRILPPQAAQNCPLPVLRSQNYRWGVGSCL